MRPTFPEPLRRERGTVLIIVLMFLTILMLMATVAVSTGVSEEKLARASRDYNVAFQAAEAALREAKADLIGIGSRSPVIIASVGFAAGCPNALCQTAAPGATPVWDVETNWDNAATYGQYTFAQTLPATGPGGVSQQPRYLIEYVAPSGSQHIYRITARGWGPLANSMPVTLQEEVLR
jgi:type IV pilus assembly protein PilX